MVRRERVINKLAEIGYVETYRPAARIIEFRQVSGVGRAYLRRRELLEDEEVVRVLVNAGLDEDAAAEFVGRNQCPLH